MAGIFAGAIRVSGKPVLAQFNSSLEGNMRRAIDLHEGDSIDAALAVRFSRGNDVAVDVASAWIVVRPVDHAAGRVGLVLTFDVDDLAGMERNRTDDIAVDFDAQQQIASIAQLEEKALVRAAGSVSGSQEGDDRAPSEHLDVRLAAPVGAANASVVGLFGLPGTAAKNGERQSESG